MDKAPPSKFRSPIKLRVNNILFIDIETVSQTPDYSSLHERTKTQWARKADYLRNEQGKTDEEMYKDRAAIYAEFGKIVVIGMGFFNMEKSRQLRIKALKNNNEKELLEEFSKILTHYKQDKLLLCAHNGKEFDFPYLCRRMLVNGIKLPYVLDTSGKKPWEVRHLDTMEMWKFGDWKHYTSLDLLAGIFGIETSKEDMDGSQVGKVYYEENDIDKIANYCMRDVAVTAQLYLKLKSKKDIEKENILFLN